MGRRSDRVKRMSMNARAADPSMEEILASIRRIIADDLPSRREPRPALEVARAPEDDFSLEDYAREEVVTPPPSAPTRRAPEPSLMGAADLPLPDPVRRLIDLAAVEDEVQAEVAMALRGSIPSEPRAAATTAQASPATTAPASPASAFNAAAPPAPADPLRSSLASLSSPVAPAPGLPPRPAFNFGQPPRPPVAPLRAPEPDRLVSAPTNAAVSASFGTLARTIMSNNSRSLEDVVAELLKPMLRSWLDDNLPTIVERLVKAEIERVSRGGR
jgi:cell pole-organizing protein PopZ